MGIVSKKPLLKSLKSSIQFFHHLGFQNRKDFQLTNPGYSYFNSLGLAGQIHTPLAPGIWFRVRRDVRGRRRATHPRSFPGGFQGEHRGGRVFWLEDHPKGMLQWLITRPGKHRKLHEVAISQGNCG